MTARQLLRNGIAATFAAAALAVGSPALAQDAAPQFTCNAPADLVRIDHPLKRFARRIAGGHAIKIVAIGSSSTSGAGASSPAMNYPSRLEA